LKVGNKITIENHRKIHIKIISQNGLFLIVMAYERQRRQASL
jgi:hypothetical protein